MAVVHAQWLDELRTITERKAWRSVVAAGLEEPRLRLAFHTYWSEASLNIRDQVGDDVALAQFLRSLLPPYRGPAVHLYRGENLARWKAGRLGFNWSSERGIAEMWGRGRNARHGGGLLLKSLVPPSLIICGPGEHSNYLGESEFVIKPQAINGIAVICEYPAID